MSASKKTDYPLFQKEGQNNDDNFQIFTPEVIVNQMLDIIGQGNVTNLNHKILEPSSGDGAFTVRILDRRIKQILNEKLPFEANILKALSTIYSIEMDEILLLAQRDNIRQLILYYSYLEKHSLSQPFLEYLEEILKYNIIWGETNIKEEISDSLFGVEIGWYMPNKDYSKPIKFYSWIISDELKITKIHESIEIG
jgi:hypothetical protein